MPLHLWLVDVKATVTRLDDFLRLNYGARIDYVLMNHEDGGHLLRMVRSAESVQGLVDIYRALYPVYEDLSLCELPSHYVAALAAGPVPLDQIGQIVRGLKFKAPELAKAYQEISHAWPSAYAALTDHQFMVFSIKRLAELDVDPTFVDRWRPFIHPTDQDLKGRAADAMLRAPSLSERKVESWLAAGSVGASDAEIIHTAWKTLQQNREFDRMASSGEFAVIDLEGEGERWPARR